MIILPATVAHCPRFIDDWLPGAMFPFEVAWLLSVVALSRAEILIKCGRQDGVSTEMLATYLKDTGVRLISIDFESDPLCAQRARERIPLSIISTPCWFATAMKSWLILARLVSRPKSTGTGRLTGFSPPGSLRSPARSRKGGVSPC
jgi:hypothetical protein